MFIVQIILGCIRCNVQYMVLPCLAGWRSARSAGCWVCSFCCFLLRILAICWASWKFSESRTENSSRKCHLGAPTRYRKMSLNNWTGPMRRSWILVVVLASMQHCHLALYAFLINFLLFLLLGFTWNILKASKRSKRKWNTVKYFEGPSFLGWEKTSCPKKVLKSWGLCYPWCFSTASSTGIRERIFHWLPLEAFRCGCLTQVIHGFIYYVYIMLYSIL